MRDGGFGDAQLLREVADAEFRRARAHRGCGRESDRRARGRSRSARRRCAHRVVTYEHLLIYYTMGLPAAAAHSARIAAATGLKHTCSTSYAMKQNRMRPGMPPASEETAVIEVQHLTKRYGPFTAVDDVSFKVERGEILGFLGPNGAGKTTTMRVLTGYMPPTDGKALVAGLRRHRATDRGQAAHRLSAGDAAALSGHDRQRVPDLLRPHQRRAEERAQDATSTTAMERTRVADMAQRHCGKLSKGYRQRVGLAQALLHNPDVLILDEPTAGLDPKQIIETRRLIKELAGDHTIILSTHILPEVSQTCQRVVIINKGRVVAVDTPDNLTAKLRGSEAMYVRSRRDGRRRQPVLAALPGVTRGQPVADTRDGHRRASKSERSRAATCGAISRRRSSGRAGGCWNCDRCA